MFSLENQGCESKKSSLVKTKLNFVSNQTVHELGEHSSDI